MLTDSPTLYYRGSRGQKIFSCAVYKFGPDVIPDSVSSASHTVIMEQYITLIQRYLGLVFIFFGLYKRFTCTTAATKTDTFTLVAVFIQNYRNCLYFTVCKVPF